MDYGAFYQLLFGILATVLSLGGLIWKFALIKREIVQLFITLVSH